MALPPPDGVPEDAVGEEDVPQAGKAAIAAASKTISHINFRLQKNLFIAFTPDNNIWTTTSSSNFELAVSHL